MSVCTENTDYFIFSPLARGGLVFAVVFNDFCQTNYLNIYRADLHKICTFGRTLTVDEGSEVIFWITKGTLPWKPILWVKSTSIPYLVVRMTFART